MEESECIHEQRSLTGEYKVELITTMFRFAIICQTRLAMFRVPIMVYEAERKVGTLLEDGAVMMMLSIMLVRLDAGQVEYRRKLPSNGQSQIGLVFVRVQERRYCITRVVEDGEKHMDERG